MYKIMSNRKIIIIGGGPSGLFTAYLLLKSGEKNVICYEKEGILGGDWSEKLPSFIHSTTVLMEKSKANDIFVDSFNYYNNKNITSSQWLNLVSKQISTSIYKEVFKNFNLIDIIKFLKWYYINKRDIHTIPLETMFSEAKISISGKRIFKLIGNIVEDGPKSVSVGTVFGTIIDNIRPSSLFLNQSLFSAREVTVNKNNLWKNLEKSIIKQGGKIYKNSFVTLKSKNQIIIKKKDKILKKNINKNDIIVIAASEYCLMNPDKFFMSEWANINIKNFPPISYVSSMQFLFYKPLNLSLFDDYSIYSGIYTEWNLIVFIPKTRIKDVKKDTLLLVTILGKNYKSSFTNKTFSETSVEDRGKEIIRQIKNIPRLKNYTFPKIKKIFGGDNIYPWASNGLIPRGYIEIKKNKQIKWACYLRSKNIASLLDGAANASIEVNKEITGKEPIKKSRTKLPLIVEYLITIIILYGVYLYLPLLLKKIFFISRIK